MLLLVIRLFYQVAEQFSYLDFVRFYLLQSLRKDNEDIA
jgi:hypothetical protein